METALSKVTPLRDGDAGYRSPPANIEAEQALLGAILVNNAAFHRVAEFLRPEHFAEAVHGRIFAAIAKLIERGQIANPVTLKTLFDQDGALAEIGGAAYLARLAAAVVTIINAEDYGRTIHDLHLRRQLISIGEDVVNDAYHATISTAKRRSRSRRQSSKLFELATSGTLRGRVPRIQIGARRGDRPWPRPPSSAPAARPASRPDISISTSFWAGSIRPTSW